MSDSNSALKIPVNQSIFNSIYFKPFNGLESYLHANNSINEEQSETYRQTLHYMNTMLTGLFTLECSMKMFAFGYKVNCSIRFMNQILGILVMILIFIH